MAIEIILFTKEAKMKAVTWIFWGFALFLAIGIGATLLSQNKASKIKMIESEPWYYLAEDLQCVSGQTPADTISYYKDIGVTCIVTDDIVEQGKVVKATVLLQDKHGKLIPERTCYHGSKGLEQCKKYANELVAKRNKQREAERKILEKCK